MNINSDDFAPNKYEDDLGLNQFSELNDEDGFSDILDFDNSANEASTSSLIASTGRAGGIMNDSINHDVYEEVEKLRLEEVRWFYKSGKKRKWKPFVGSDSISIEYEWRKLSNSQYDAARVCVRGGMHEVDVVEKKCFPVYWSSENMRGEMESTDIMRGTWFYDNNYMPLPEDLANRIELEHIERWKGLNIHEISQLAGYKVMHSVKLEGCHVDWNSVSDVFLHSDAAQYRALRNIVQRFGVSKTTTTGYRLRRGYREDAMYEDCIPPVEHLIFVVHGIGAKPDRQKIVRNTNTLRAACRIAEARHFCGILKRVEFLPVEWRANLKLDGGVVSTITPKKGHGMRQFLNNNAMDILYYTSPLYRTEIVDGLRKEISRLYKMFCERNPNFKGKISIFAHSLGTVIVHDILIDWQPESLYEKYLMVQLKRNTESMQGLLQSNGNSTASLQVDLEKINSAQRHVLEVEEEFLHSRSQNQQRSASSVNGGFPFHVENLFFVGSPLPVFLTLRGYKPSNGAGTQDDIVPSHMCHRIFNIFHPADPVAYRLEPLILPHCSGIAPLQIHHHAANIKTQYNDLPTCPYSETSSKEMTTMQNNDEEDEENSSSDSEGFNAAPPEDVKYSEVEAEIEDEKDLSKQEAHGSNTKGQEEEECKTEGKTSYLASAFGRVGRTFWARPQKLSSQENDSDDNSNSSMDRSNSASPLPTSPGKRNKKKICDEEEVLSSTLSNSINTELEHRIDYELIEGFTESKLGYASLTSHTSYWSNMDLALFILMQIHHRSSMLQSIQTKNNKST